jgi:hypothetical protein
MKHLQIIGKAASRQPWMQTELPALRAVEGSPRVLATQVLPQSFRDLFQKLI